MPDQPLERWGTSASYERFVGRWSRRVALQFLDWLAVPPGRAWVDVGCGTGALVQAILARAEPASVVGIDRAPGFVQDTARELADARVRLDIGDATALPLDDAAADVAVAGLVLNFVADPAAMVREMRRVIRPGGTVAAYVWDYAGGMQMMRHFWDAAVAVSPRDVALDQAERFPLCRPEPLAALWQAQGLSGVQVVPIDIPTVFRDFDDFWTPFLGRQGAAPTYLATLDAATQQRIRDLLAERLPPGPDGAIALRARAWAVQGTAQP